MLVVPRLAWPSWRWITLSGTPSRASSTAWAWRSWCGAKRRRIPAWAASRRNSTRALALDHGRPRVGPSMTQNSGPTGSSRRAASGEPGAQLLPAPGVHADLAAPAALAAAHQQPAAPEVAVALAERQRLRDAQPAPPEHDHQRAQPLAVGVVAGLAHHGDDLVHGRRVGGIEPPLVAGRTSGVIPGHRRRRATPTSGIEHC